MINDGKISSDKVWEVCAPAFRMKLNEVIGLGQIGKEMVLKEAKRDVLAISEETILDNRAENHVQSVLDKWFDTKRCNNCLHSIVCGKTKMIEDACEAGIKCRYGCDDWCSKEG